MMLVSVFVMVEKPTHQSSEDRQEDGYGGRVAGHLRYAGGEDAGDGDDQPAGEASQGGE